MRVGYYQFNPLFGEVKRNLDRVATRLGREQCDLMVLPELFASGYQFVSKAEVDALAEPVPEGPTTQQLLELARARGMHLVAGLPERHGGQCYNSAIVVGPRGFLGVYRKAHLFFQETLYFSPGDTGFRVWDIGEAKIGVMVCFDWFYPEAARTLALKGAEIVCHPSNLVLPHCPDAMVTRCLENRVFGITANRIGFEARGDQDRLTYIGKSQVVSPRGRVLHRSPADQEELTVLEIDPAEARDKSLNPHNDLLRDRRKDQYELS
jgi:predicted amidohydrolase